MFPHVPPAFTLCRMSKDLTGRQLFVKIFCVDHKQPVSARLHASWPWYKWCNAWQECSLHGLKGWCSGYRLIIPKPAVYKTKLLRGPTWDFEQTKKKKKKTDISLIRDTRGTSCLHTMTNGTKNAFSHSNCQTGILAPALHTHTQAHTHTPISFNSFPICNKS